jgi:hypothetical protein
VRVVTVAPRAGAVITSCGGVTSGGTVVVLVVVVVDVVLVVEVVVVVLDVAVVVGGWLVDGAPVVDVIGCVVVTVLDDDADVSSDPQAAPTSTTARPTTSIERKPMAILPFSVAPAMSPDQNRRT